MRIRDVTKDNQYTQCNNNRVIYHHFVECLCVSFFGGFRPTREFFTHMETSPLPLKGYVRHSWSLCSDGSLACHTYCYTGHPFIMTISEDPWHLHLLSSVWQCHYLFLPLWSVALCWMNSSWFCGYGKTVFIRILDTCTTLSVGVTRK